MTIEIALLISIVSVCFSVFIGLKSNKRTDVKDIEERVRENTKINMKLDNIAGSIKELKNERLSLKEEIQKHDKEIIRVDASAKQAHHRLDAIEQRLNTNGGGNHDKD